MDLHQLDLKDLSEVKDLRERLDLLGLLEPKDNLVAKVLKELTWIVFFT